jgi:hypothetical protein
MLKCNDDVSQNEEALMPKFAETFCSQCGRTFGPGDHGYSHCQDHHPGSEVITSIIEQVENQAAGKDTGCLTMQAERNLVEEIWQLRRDLAAMKRWLNRDPADLV